jgi:hypothetical protein
MKADGKAASAAGARAPLRFAPSASATSSNFAGVAGADFIFNRSHANTRARRAQMRLLKLTAVSALLLASTQALALGSGGNGSGTSSAGLGIDVGALNAAGAGGNPGVAVPRFLSGPGMGGPIAGLIVHFGHIPVPPTPQKNEQNAPIPGIDVVVRKESGGSAIGTQVISGDAESEGAGIRVLSGGLSPVLDLRVTGGSVVSAPAPGKPAIVRIDGDGGSVSGSVRAAPATTGNGPSQPEPQKNEENNPIPGIDVVVRKEPGGSAIHIPTDGNGGFSVSGLKAGSYAVSVDPHPATPEAHYENNPIPGIDIVILKQPNGNAINTTTDDHGGFTLGNLKAGTYTVAVNPPAPNQGQPPHLATQSTIVNGPDTIKVVTTFVPAQPGQTQNNGPITVTVPRDGMNITGVVVSSDTPKSAENFLRIEGHIGRDK